MPDVTRNVTSEEALRRVEAAYADRARIVDGWTPSEVDLAGVETLHCWTWDRHPEHGLLSIRGYLTDEVRVSTPYRLTSPVVAVLADEAGRGWARTWSRYYLLDETQEADHKPGLITSESTIETDRRAFEVDYRAPPVALEPTARIGEDNRQWRKLWDWFDENTKNGQASLLVFISRKYNVDLGQVYMNTDSLCKSRYNDGMGGYN